MALKRLTTAEMVSVTKKWVTPGDPDREDQGNRKLPGLDGVIKFQFGVSGEPFEDVTRIGRDLSGRPS